MKDISETLSSIFVTIVFVFAFGSSVYCLSLILQKLFNVNNGISLSFFICIFMVGFVLNILDKNKK